MANKITMKIPKDRPTIAGADNPYAMTFDRPEDLGPGPEYKDKRALEPHPRAFTNRPQNIGQEAAPGVPWEFTPDESIPERPIEGSKGELTGGKVRGPIKEGVDMAGALEEIDRLEDLIKPPGDRPDQKAKVSDYSAAERGRFRQQIIGEHLDGVDPVTINPFEILDDVEQNLMPQLFDQFFQGRRLYQDWEKGMLSKEEEAAWMDRYKEIRAKTFNMAKQKRQFGEQMLDEMMGRWDAVAKDFHARLQDIRKQSEQQRKVAAKAKQTESEEQRKQRKANVSMTKDVLNAENNIKENLQDSEAPAGKDYRKTGKIPAGKLRQLNSLRKAAGKPALKERKEGDRFVYEESVTEDTNTVKDLSPEDEKLLKETFPEAMQDKDGRWMAPNDQGKYVYIVKQ